MKYAFDCQQTLRRRLARVNEPHVAPLQAMARRVCTHGPSGGPLFDPDFGGIDARVGILLATPGPAVSGRQASAQHRIGTGLVSPDNPDPSAKRVDLTLKSTGFARRNVVLWNVIPWYLPRLPSGKLNNGRVADQKQAMPALFEFLALCPRLRVLLLGGRVAQAAGRRAFELDPKPFQDLWVLGCSHTSRQAMNGAPDRLKKLEAAFQEAKRLMSKSRVERREGFFHALY